MQSWELCAPPVASGSLVPLGCPSTPRSVSSDEESAYGDKDESFTSNNSSDPYPWEKEDDSHAGASTHAPSMISFAVNSSTTSRPPSYSTATPQNLVPDSPSVQFFPSGCVVQLTPLASCSPMFGPVTPTFSPNVARAQWWIAVKSLMIGAFVMWVLFSSLGWSDSLFVHCYTGSAWAPC